MKTRRLAKSLLALAVILPLAGCMTQRTVTRNGQTVEQGLVVKRPLKEAAGNSN
jgi:outer membrane protein assembly factor BamE (lipoprotein component of BamABCDE complex)